MAMDSDQRKRSTAAIAREDERHEQQQPQNGAQGFSCPETCHIEREVNVLQQKKDQANTQLPLLPTEVLNVILSYTGTQAAILAAGPALMRTWSDENIAEWCYQHCVFATDTVDADPEESLIHAVGIGLDGPALLLVPRAGGTACYKVFLAMTAARHGCVGILNLVLDWMSDLTIPVDLLHQQWNTLMEHACFNGQLKVVKALLDRTRPVVSRSSEENSKYLLFAAVSGHADVLKELLDPSQQHHANAKDDDYPAPCSAAQHGHLDCLRVLLDTSRASCASSDAADRALVLAAQHGHLHIVPELLDTSRPNHAKADAQSFEALLYAATYGHTDILRVLLSQEHHAANANTTIGDDALEMAVKKGQLECCRVLLNYVCCGSWSM